MDVRSQEKLSCAQKRRKIYANTSVYNNINSFVLLYKQNYKVENGSGRTKNKVQDPTFKLFQQCQDYTKLLMKSDTPKPTTPDIKEAIHYAMIKAHPDNGGKQEDFVKFRKLYERMNNEYR